MTAATVVSERGNTPLDTVPADYLPEGAIAQWLVLGEGPDAGKKLFFYDVVMGEGEVGATVIFIHGNPECSYTYRQTMDHLAERSGCAVRIIAMDHIGFGLSDQASFEMVDYHHSRNLRQLVEYLDLQDVTLVIHDWGGAIGVGTFIEMPQRVSSLVLMNTTVFPLPQEGSNYTNFPFPGPLGWSRLGSYLPWQFWKHIPPLVMTSPAGKAAFARHSLKSLFRSLTGRFSEEERMYFDMFSTQGNARSSMRNVKQTAVWGHGYRYFDEVQGWQDNREFYRNMQAEIGKEWGPEGKNINVRAFWGMFDPCAKPEVQQQWLNALPQLEGHIVTFAGRGHFLEEHEPEAIARGIISAAGITAA